MKAALPRVSLIQFALLFLVVAALLLVSVAPRAEESASWSGEWQIFTRSGQFIMTLNQLDDEVTGTVQPGTGRIEARAEVACYEGAGCGTVRAGQSCLRFRKMAEP